MTAAGTVVVGGSVAGVRVAQQLRRGGDQERIVLVDAEAGNAYDKPALSKEVLTTDSSQPPTLATTADLAAAAIEHRTGVAASGLDLAAHHVVLADGERLPFGKLVIATGVSPRRLPVLERLPGAHYLRTRSDARALCTAFEGRPEVVMVGGGFIGLEVAAAARSRGLQVTVLEAATALLQRVLPAAVGQDVHNLHRDHGVDVRCGSTAVGVHGHGRIEAVELADGRRLPADVVLIGVGAVPNTRWLDSSPLPVSDGVVCNEFLQVAGTDDIWAAGDVARWHNPRYGVLQRVEHWTTAREHATVVAANILTDRVTTQRSCDAVPYVWSDQFGRRIQHVGVVPPGSVTQLTETRDGRGRLFVHLGADGRVAAATAFDAQFDLLQVRRDLQQQLVPASP